MCVCVGVCEGRSIWAAVMAELVIKRVFCANMLECKCGVMRFLRKRFTCRLQQGFQPSHCNLFLIWSSLLRTRGLFLCISQPGGVGTLVLFLLVASPR